MSKIKSYQELLVEKDRLEAALESQKQIIQQEILDLKEELRPVIQIISGVSKVTGGIAEKPWLNLAVKTAGNLLLQGLMLSTSGRVVQSVVPFLTKSLSSYFLRKRKSNGHIVG